MTDDNKPEPILRAEKGHFQKGVSGNPAGRAIEGKKQNGRVRDLARAHTVPALATLVRIMNDKEAPHSAQLSAANYILERGWGKPAQAIIGGDEDDPPILIQKIERVLVSANAADRDG